MNKTLESIFDYVKFRSPWADDTEDSVVVKQAEIAVADLAKGKDKSRLITRICGQTGSGKTTQALWAVQEYNKNHNRNPVVVAVREFAGYHPNYEKLLQTAGKDNIRELTNGFALKCLAAALKLLFEAGYEILLDLTLLAPEFEEYVLELIDTNKYKAVFHLMAVNDEISKQFLTQRQKQSGRIVYKSSIDYFNTILVQGLKFLISHDKKIDCFVWMAQTPNYIFKGKLCDAWAAFETGRSLTNMPTIPPEILRKEKLKILESES